MYASQDMSCAGQAGQDMSRARAHRVPLVPSALASPFKPQKSKNIKNL